MTYFIVEAEVAGSLGGRTIADFSAHPPRIQHVHYEFDGWLGDQLLESFPCYIIADDLAKDIAGLSGFRLSNVEVSLSEQFHEVTAPGEPNPISREWHWLRIEGGLGSADFALDSRHRLIVSERAMSRIAHGLRHASIELRGDDEHA